MKRIGCIGDSLTYGYGCSNECCWVSMLENSKRSCQIINLGINGDTTVGMMNRFIEDTVNNNVNIAIIMGGINDLMHNRKIENILKNIEIIVHEAKENNIVPIIIGPIYILEAKAKILWDEYCDYKRVNLDVEKYNDMLKEFSNRNDIKFIELLDEFSRYDIKSNLYTDGVHLTERGNEIIYIKVNEALNNIGV